MSPCSQQWIYLLMMNIFVFNRLESYHHDKRGYSLYTHKQANKQH